MNNELRMAVNNTALNCELPNPVHGADLWRRAVLNSGGFGYKEVSSPAILDNRLDRYLCDVVELS